MEERRSELVGALAAFHMEVRPDSNLCREYIFGSCKFTVEEIVAKLCLMRFLYEYAGYKEEREKLLSELRSDRPPPPGYIAYEARRRALENHPLPEKWPWMK